MITFILTGLCFALMGLGAFSCLCTTLWVASVYLHIREAKRDWPRAEARNRWSSALRSCW